MTVDTPIELMVEQLNYLPEKVGENHVGLPHRSGASCAGAPPSNR
jgi:hypothetical protein